MIPTEALIGAPLTELQDDFKLVPQGILQNYLSDTSVDPSSGFIRTVALAELSRRKRVQDESNAASQPDPTNRPTVAQELAGIPAVQPAQPAPSDQPANFAHGGIIAFNGEADSKVPFADDESLPLAERIKRTLARTRRGTSDLDTTRLSLAERWNRPEGDPISDAPYPENAIRHALASPTILPPAAASNQAGPAVPGQPPIRNATRPAATPTAPKDEGIARLVEFNKQQQADLAEMSSSANFTPEQEEAARTAAAKRLSAVQDPYMKTIADLQAKQAQIGESRGGDPFGRAMMQLGLGMMKGIGRPGTGINALGEAGLGALASYEKEELGKIDRATKTTQLQIELQKELMKQGVDRVTAGNVAAKEARNIEEDRAKEIRTAAKERITARTGIEGAIQRNEYQNALIEAKQQMLHLQEQLAAARASGNLAQMDIARQRIEIAQGNLNRLVEETARKNIQAQIKTIQDNIPLALSKEGQAQIKALNAQLGALGTGGGGSSTATTNSQFPGFSVGNP